MRHGKTGMIWHPDSDLGLNETGTKQACKFAQKFSTKNPTQIICSPLKRARESALPLSAVWKTNIIYDSRIGEVPFPRDCQKSATEWLSDILKSKWSKSNKAIKSWKNNAYRLVHSISEDTIIFTHFLTISAVVSTIKKSDIVNSTNVGNLEIVKLLKTNQSIEIKDSSVD